MPTAPDLDPTLEAATREALTRLAAAVPVPPAPASAPLSPSSEAGAPAAGHRRLAFSVAAAVAVVAAGGTAIAVSSRSEQPAPADVATAPAAGEPCRPLRATGDVLARGEFPDGTPWEVTNGAGTGGPEWVEGAFASIDGEGAGGWTNNADSWPTLVNDGTLGWLLATGDDGAGDHRLVYGQVPTSAARVEVTLDGGTTVAACPVELPGVEVVRYFAVPLPPGLPIVGGRALDAQGRPVAEMTPLDGGDRPTTLEAQVVPGRVPLPLGGEAAALPDAPVMHDVVTGELPSGRWALRLGADGDAYAVHFVEPARIGHSGSEGDLDQLLGADHTWNVDTTDDRHLVWGLTSPDATLVRVTLDDGTSVDVPTVDPGIPSMPARAFAAALPESRHVTAMEALAGDGRAVERGVDVERSVAPLATFDPDLGVSLLVEPVDRPDPTA